jgi:hypothetical protein
MLHSVVDYINSRIKEVLQKAKIYGIARTATRDGSIMPVTSDGEWIKYAGVDDIYSAIIYHKHLSISSANAPRSGFGDNISDLVNTNQMTMVVFMDEKKTGITADQLYTLIQAQITGILKLDGYKSVRIGVSSAILNDAQVWAQEYGNTPLQLKASQRLIQLGYSIVVTLDKNCITIPKCKN